MTPTKTITVPVDGITCNECGTDYPGEEYCPVDEDHDDALVNVHFEPCADEDCKDDTHHWAFMAHVTPIEP